MITKQEAIDASEFHSGCSASVGPRGGIKHQTYIYRRNGATQTWKTRPTWFRIPVKRGMYEYAQITHNEEQYWYTRQTCPVCSAVSDHYKDPEALRKALSAIKEGG